MKGQEGQEGEGPTATLSQRLPGQVWKLLWLQVAPLPTRTGLLGAGPGPPQALHPNMGGGGALLREEAWPWRGNSRLVSWDTRPRSCQPSPLGLMTWGLVLGVARPPAKARATPRAGGGCAAQVPWTVIRRDLGGVCLPWVCRRGSASPGPEWGSGATWPQGGRGPGRNEAPKPRVAALHPGGPGGAQEGSRGRCVAPEGNPPARHVRGGPWPGDGVGNDGSWVLVSSFGDDENALELVVTIAQL